MAELGLVVLLLVGLVVVFLSFACLLVSASAHENGSNVCHDAVTYRIRT